MQKYTIPLLIILIVGSVIWEINQTINKIDINKILSSEDFVRPTPTPIRVPNGNIIETEYNGRKFFILNVKIPITTKISLIPNFKEKTFAENLMTDNNCSAAINGGFYLGNDKPLGLFINKGQTFGKTVKSNIANAFVWMDSAGYIKFLKSVPEYLDFTEFIFQTGPYILPVNKPLNLIQDERARRSILGKDIKGYLYYISITEKENLTMGPYLADIPVIFWNLKQKNILNMEEMVNLDGGSASFFFAKDKISNFSLTSWAPVGSVLCAKF